MTFKLTFKNHSYSFRYQKTVEVPQVRTVRYGTRSFRSTVAKIWNSLSQHFRDITSFNVYKNQIHGAEGPVHVHSVQIVNSVFNLFYLLFVCILMFSIYPEQLFPLHRS